MQRLTKPYLGPISDVLGWSSHQMGVVHFGWNTGRERPRGSLIYGICDLVKTEHDKGGPTWLR